MGAQFIVPKGVAVTKIDLKKQLKQLYNPPVKEVVFVEVPGMNFLMVE